MHDSFRNGKQRGAFARLTDKQGTGLQTLFFPGNSVSNRLFAVLLRSFTVLQFTVLLRSFTVLQFSVTVMNTLGKDTWA